MVDPDKSDVYSKLRTLAAQNPREARMWFCHLLDCSSPDLNEVLRCAAGLGEGRVRQLIANAIRRRPDKDTVIPHLQEWLAAETDEFAKHAIVAVLATVDISAYQQRPESAIEDPYLVEAYRYLRERLCHELRNALMEPQTHILWLRDKINSIGDEVLRADLETLLGQLSDAFKSVGRIIEFNADDHYFKLRPIPICSWLKIMNDEYAKKYRPLIMSIEDRSNGSPIHILASDHLLYVIFWNLWKNSQQAVNGDCEIVVHVTRNTKEVHLLIVDNGHGFSQDLREVAFHERYSSKGAHHGRGLLEVQDAVHQLRGKADLVPYRLGDFRVMLTFPLEAT